jgi:hypothetical protein
MRKTTLLIVLLMSTVTGGACDICGCSARDYRLGVLPDFRRNIIGVSYADRTFTSVHPPLFSWEKETQSQELFVTLDFRLRMFVDEHWLFAVHLPWHNYLQRESTHTTLSRGMGDVQLGVGRLFNLQKNTTPDRLQQLLIFTAIEGPTGASNRKFSPDDLWIPNLQPGSGSWDALVNLNYLKRSNASVYQVQVGGRFNGENATHYRFGHRASGALKIMRFINLGETGKHQLLPGIELMGAVAQADRDREVYSLYSGGHSVAANISVDYFTSTFTVGASVSQPLYQHIAGGQITQGWSSTLSIHYLF